MSCDRCGVYVPQIQKPKTNIIQRMKEMVSPLNKYGLLYEPSENDSEPYSSYMPTTKGATVEEKLSTKSGAKTPHACQSITGGLLLTSPDANATSSE
jgi:aromatic ring hydroxylase